tara:strand:+ start:615 stop:761 length:147 start_codon:yes stop_codon:yes gene_type:complete
MMKYVLIWHYHHGSEEIDECDTAEEAQFLKSEYQMAYGGHVTVKRVRQ